MDYESDTGSGKEMIIPLSKFTGTVYVSLLKPILFTQNPDLVHLHKVCHLQTVAHLQKVDHFQDFGSTPS